MRMSAGAHRATRLDALELVVMSHLMWMLGIKLRFSGGAVRGLHH